VDNQSAFWLRHPYVYGKTFPAFSFSSAMATVATERKNGNGMVETRHFSLLTSVRSDQLATAATEWKNGNGTTERHNGTAMAERQRKGGNQAY